MPHNRLGAVLSTIFFCCLLLFPRPACADSSTPPEPPISPFAAIGLTAHPRETAEEILLRAHNWDTRAIALVVAEYSQGIGGFPKSWHLAGGWLSHLTFLGAMESFSFSTLQLWATKESPAENLPAKLGDCDMARSSPLVPLFKQAGIFDLDQLCAKLGKQKDPGPGWREAYRENVPQRKNWQKKCVFLCRFFVRCVPAPPPPRS